MSSLSVSLTRLQSEYCTPFLLIYFILFILSINHKFKFYTDFTCSVGPYFSYPVSSRWSAGSKLLAGYSRFSKYTLSSSTAEIGKKGGLTFGSGLSMNYMVKQNFGVRFFVDYNLLPSPVPGNCTIKHLLTVGGSVKVQFVTQGLNFLT